MSNSNSSSNYHQQVYYFIADVSTGFDSWLGCATKKCKSHKKNKQVCHIRPGTHVYPVGNGLYECDECHNKRPNWLPPDTDKPCTLYPLSPGEAKELRDRLVGLQEFMATRTIINDPKLD